MDVTNFTAIGRAFGSISAEGGPHLSAFKPRDPLVVRSFASPWDNAGRSSLPCAAQPRRGPSSCAMRNTDGCVPKAVWRVLLGCLAARRPWRSTPGWFRPGSWRQSGRDPPCVVRFRPWCPRETGVSSACLVGQESGHRQAGV